MSHDCNCKRADRYASFSGIDRDGNARCLMGMIDAHLAIAERCTAF